MIKEIMNKIKQYEKKTLEYIGIHKNSNINIIITNEEKTSFENNLYFNVKKYKTVLDQEKIGQDLVNLINSQIFGNIQILSDIKDLNLCHVFNGFILSNWQFDLYKEIKNTNYDLKFNLNGNEKLEFQKIWKKETEPVFLARYLSLISANDLNPHTYEDFIVNLFKNTEIEVEVIKAEKLKKLGLNLIYAVGQASKHEPRIIILKKGKNPKKAFVGKGITHDTGGLSLKPSDSMIEMYYDMTGSASVVATMYGLINEPNIEYYGVLAIAENSIGSNAYRPGDILKAPIGKTIEIGNTDAEGRLVLADACYHIVNEYKVEQIVCMATLTGAASVALGSQYAALMSNDENLSHEIIKIWKDTGNNLHPLPFDDIYSSYLKSTRADLNNISKKGAGTITGWKFIEVLCPKNTKFLGIDIAAYLSNDFLKHSSVIANCLFIRSMISYLKK